MFKASPTTQLRWVTRLKPLVFVCCLLPFADLVYRAMTSQLEAEPIKDITVVTGDWGLRFLLITLCITPIRQIIRWPALIRVRRMLGLFAFFYVCLHFATYIVLDQFFAWQFILEDITDRPYILIGFTAFLLLIPLAATSTRKMVKRLGGQRWQKLHRLVYVIAILGVLHHLLLVKADISKPAVHGVILIILLGYRFLWAGEFFKKKTVAKGVAA